MDQSGWPAQMHSGHHLTPVLPTVRPHGPVLQDVLTTEQGLRPATQRSYSEGELLTVSVGDGDTGSATP